MKLGLIGGGNMARAITVGALRTGFVAGPDVLISEPDEARQAELAKLGITAVWDNSRVAAGCDLLILAVKPQMMDAALVSIRPVLNPAATLVVSIAAGRTIASIEAHLPAGARLVRVMPNTPLLVGAGMSVLCRSHAASDADLDQVRRLFAAGGRVMELDERHFDAVTAVSGSGPAYFFLMSEALRDAAVAVGLPPEAAALLTEQTLIGAARLLAETGQSPQELRRQVTSPGGTTAAAVDSLQTAGFRQLLDRAVAAAVRRGRELAGYAG